VTKPPDLRDLVGGDVPESQREGIERADSVLRAVPPPPAELPPSLTSRVLAVTARTPPSRRRLGLGLALATALAVAIAGISFGVGYRLGGDEFEVVRTIVLTPTADAPGSSASIKVGAPDDATGNWGMVVEIAGLPKLPANGYYVLWLARDGEYAATCGTFDVGSGSTSVYMNASYRLEDFDEWVISPRVPGEESEPPWLLSAPTT
jgi:hypothetical protein